MSESPNRIVGRIGKVTLVVWFLLLTLVSAGLLSRHLLALPAPIKTARLGHELVALSHRPGSWLAVHVLDSECRCSQRIAAHLVDGDRPANWSELVLWIGDVPPPSSLIAKFDVRRVTGGELAALGIEAAPLLLAVSPDAEVRYAGGYTDRKQGPVIHDIEILDATRAAVAPPALPLFGCATSARLKNALSTLPTL